MLLLFSGPTFAQTIEEMVETAPAAGRGYVIDRPATEGEWRMVLELADTAAGIAVAWYDITRFYAGDAYQRGANEYLGKYAAAVAQVQLQTDDDSLAPWGQDTTDVFGTDINLDAGLLMRLGLIRVVSSVVVEWEPLWTGRVETWGDASAARGQIRTHIVTVVDTIADLANVPTAIEANNVPWQDWLDENLSDAGWLFGRDYYGDEEGMGTDPTLTAAIIRMDQAADLFGLVWRSRRTGRLIVHPAPWDTTNTDRWDNPLLDSYPSGLVFSYSPDFTNIEYIADDEQQPFGIQRTSLGVLNSLIITFTGDFGPEVYAVDDPVSAGRYGVRPFTASWTLGGFDPQVADDLLAARAYSSSQALPLRTTLDHQGFWSAMALIDQFDPVTVVHATTDTGPVVTGTGTVRNVTETRTIRGADTDDDVFTLSWQSTVQVDLDTTDTSPALLPVEDLMWLSSDSGLSATTASAVFSWTNPTQPDITPTEVQLRVLGRSLIWMTEDYPGVGADGTTINWLEAGRWDTLQVRLVRRSGGVITAVSAIRAVRFPTPNRIFPIPVPAGDSTDVEVGQPPDFDAEDCSIELELQENDGTGWTTIESYDESDLIFHTTAWTDADGNTHPANTWSLIYEIPNSTFEPDKIYRFRSREICGTVIGDWINGSSFDPPDDWTNPCTDPPALALPPWDDAALLVYVPKVCQGDDIVEAVSGITGVTGDAFDGFIQFLDEPDRLALSAIADPAWSETPAGILAYGECPQINGETGSKSIAVLASVAVNESCVLVECASMQISAGVGSGSNWIAQAAVHTVDGTMSLISSDLAVGNPDGDNIAATYNAATGEFILYVNGVEVDTDTIGAASDTITVLPIWRVGAPPESWVTDCSLWSRVLAANEIPGNTVDLISIVGWHSAYWANGPDMLAESYANGAAVSPWPDEVGAEDMTGTIKPLYVWSDTNFNNHRSVSFDGATDHRLEYLASLATAQNQPYSIVVIGRFSNITQAGSGGPVGNATGPSMFDGGGPSAAGAQARLRLSAPSGTTLYAMVAGGTEVKSGTVDTSPHCLMAYYDGASSRLEVDGSSVLTGNPGSAQWDGISVGYANGAGVDNWRLRGDIAFLGVYFGDVESDGGWATFKSVAGSFYGITIA